MQTTSAALRRRLLAVLTATALGGAATVALLVPAATAATDPCAASEIARTVGSVATDTGDYLDSHPETNQAMTDVVRQPAGPQSVSTLQNYFAAHPKTQRDVQTLTKPLAGLSSRCKLPITVPQLLGLMQSAQNGGGLPAGLPGVGAQPVAGTPGAAPAVTAPADLPTRPGPRPGPHATPTTGR